MRIRQARGGSRVKGLMSGAYYVGRRAEKKLWKYINLLT